MLGPLGETLAAARAHFGGHDVLAARVLAPAGWLPAARGHGAGRRARRPAGARDARRQRHRARGHRRDAAGRGLRLGPRRARRRDAAVRPAGSRPWTATRSPLELAAGDTTITGVAFTGGAIGIAGDPRAGDPSLVLRAPTRTRCSPACTRSSRRTSSRCSSALSARTGRPLRALWRSAGDRLGGAFLWLGEVVGMRERAWELGTRCMTARARSPSAPAFACSSTPGSPSRRATAAAAV